jgi:hypothetical protein
VLVVQALVILGALYLPGHFLGRRLVRKGDGLSELFLLRIAASAAVAGPLLTLLALVGWFTVPAILLSLGVCALAAFFFGRGEGGEVRATWWDLGPLALALGGFALYARPAEYVVNSRDPGVYTLVAARLARTGELLARDPLVGVVGPFHEFFEGKKYPALFIHGQDLIVPQFFPGPFAWLGVGNLVGGIWGSLYVVPVMGALAVATTFLLGRELFGRWAGLVGAVLLAASYTQVWWSRHPSSEVMAQFFVLCGLWLAVRFARRGGATTGVLAGLLLGTAMIVRVDGFLAAAAVPLLFGYDLFTRRRARRWLLPGMPLALSAGASLLYLNTLGGRYLYIIYTEHGLDRVLGFLPYVAGALGVLVAVFWSVRARWGERFGGWLEIRGAEVALGVAFWIVGVALWAYFVLPVPWETLPEDLRDYNGYRSQVLVRMVWFTTPAVAVLGIGGFLLAAYRLNRPRTILLGAVLGFGVLYTVMPNVAPDLPWATRRFVPAVFPGLCLLAGYAAVEAGRAVGRLWNPRWGVAVSALLAAVAVVWTVQAMFPILGFREYEGAVAAFDRVEREMPEAEVVYMEMPQGYDFTASTFEYLYDRPVLPYDRDLFRREVEELQEVGLLDDALYVTTNGGPAPLISGVDFREAGRGGFVLPRLLPTEGHEPRLGHASEKWRMAYRIFRVEVER